MRRTTSIRCLFGLATVLSLAAVACSNDVPGDPSTTGGGSSGNPSDASTTDVPANDASVPIDASSDASPPIDAATDPNRPPGDAARDPVVDASRPNDVDAGRPADVSSDAGITDSIPPGSDATLDANRVDVQAPDVVGPSDAGCDSTLTGVDLFRCQALTYGMPVPLVQDLTTAAGPRLSGSIGLANAVTWAVDTMTALGFQNVHTEAVTVPHWERGDGHAELLGTTEQPLSIAALGGSVATAAGGVEAEVIEVASVSALNALPNSQVQGKIVFVNVVTQRTKDAAGYGATVSARRSGPSAAASKGAAAYIVRSITPATNASPHTGDMNSASIPAVAIGVADAIVLSDAIKAGTTRVRITLGCETLPSVQSANVIGEILGKEKPDEIVLLGAHLDSWDLATGALDDGAGVAMIIEAARLISVYAPDSRRTIRVVLFANEEFGLSGANAYASAHQAELAKHVMACEADLGGDRVYGVTFQAASSATTTLRDLYAPLTPLGITTATSGGDYGADLGPIRRQGVPVTELEQDLTYYFDYHHSPEDTMSAVDPAALTQATAAMAVFAYQVGRSSVDFGRAQLLPEGARESEH